MAENPEIQARCLWEIDDDFGDIILSFQLIAYVETTIYFRNTGDGSVVPLSVVHRASADTTLLGNDIRTKTVYIPPIWTRNTGEIHMNVARTEILDDTGKLQKDHVLLSFSVEPRG